MRDCIVLGSGRSGTSLVAGTLAQAGYHLGGTPHGARTANPKGFFETPEVNGLNELLLAPLVPARPPLHEGQRWLAVLPPGTEVPVPPAAAARIGALVAQQPFCFKDPRFCHTLPAWRPWLGDAAFVCVFRHPVLTARSILEECRTAPYLHDVDLDEAGALRVWDAMYAQILEVHRHRGDWLFLHLDQALAPAGLQALARHTGAAVDASFPDGGLHRPPPDVPLPEPLRERYAALCDLAGYTPPALASGKASAKPLPRVSVLVLAAESDRIHLPRVLDECRRQRGVDLDVVVVDRSWSGDLALPGATVVHEPSPAWGRALHRGLAACAAPHVALQEAAAGLLPNRLRRQVAALHAAPAAGWCTCDLVLTDRWQQFGRRVSVDASDLPPAGWCSTVLARREALAEVAETTFFPVALQALRGARAGGRAVHVAEALVTVDQGAFAGGRTRMAEDGALLRLASGPAVEAPLLTVSLCTFNRRPVLAECLEAFCRQQVSPGTFELVVVDDGSTDGTAELLDGLRWPVPVTVIHQPNGGLAAARNTGLARSRGRYVLFVNDDTIPLPDLVERHLTAHRAAEERGEQVLVLGRFDQPPEALGQALNRYLESSDEVFSYASLSPGQDLDGRFAWTCNVSAPLAAVREVGGFDPSFRHYGCEDTDLGLRLEQRGFKVRFHPEIRAWHRHVLSLDDLARRQRTVARAWVRLFRKHPWVLARWRGTAETTARGCALLLERDAPAAAVAAEAARTLAHLDLAPLERVGGECAETVSRVLATLAAQVKVLNRTWWHEGYLEGFREHGLDGFPDLLLQSPVALPELPRPVTLLVPDPKRPEWLEIAAAWVAGEAGGTLLLRAHPVYGYPADRLAEEAGGLAAGARAAGKDLVVGEIPLPASLELRLFAAVDAWVPVPGAHLTRHRRLAARAGRPSVEPGIGEGPEMIPGGLAPVFRVGADR